MNYEEIGVDDTDYSACYRNSRNAWGFALEEMFGSELSIGLTVMPTKVLCKHLASVRNVNGNKAFRSLTRDELDAALKLLIKLINKKVLKKKYTHFGEKLKMVMVIEGEKSMKDLHAHFAIKKPENMCIKQFVKLIRYALEVSGEFEIKSKTYNIDTDNVDKKYRYKLDLVDSGWLYYITKELHKNDKQNLYFI
jgi:hypothetical protein